MDQNGSKPILNYSVLSSIQEESSLANQNSSSNAASDQDQDPKHIQMEPP